MRCTERFPTGDAIRCLRAGQGAVGAVGLAGRQHPVGYHFAGRRVTVRLDQGLLQLVDGGVLLRNLLNPLTPAELARLRDTRLAGPPPQPPADPLPVERRINHGDELLTEVARTTSKNVARFKVRKPEPPRKPQR